MRNIININRKWAFAKGITEVPAAIPAEWNWVNLPHSWNAIDGQDGGNDYYRGTCCYAQTFDKLDLPTAEKYYLEIQGANSSADVYVGGEKLERGYYLSQGGLNTGNWEFLGDWSDIAEADRDREDAQWYLVHLGYDKFRIRIIRNCFCMVRIKGFYKAV